MSERRVGDETTLNLGRALIVCRQEYAKTCNLTWMNPWRRLHRDSSKKRLLERGEEIAGELAVRYEGIMFQLFIRANGEETLDSEIWKNLQTIVWLSVGDGIRTTRDPRHFTRVLWNVYVKRLDSEASVESLKPKFMLRQFIDEMPSSDERGVLRAMAYGWGGAPSQSGKELLHLIQLSLPILHDQLLLHASDLDALTDGALTESLVRSFSEPYDEYRTWLFYS